MLIEMELLEEQNKESKLENENCHHNKEGVETETVVSYLPSAEVPQYTFEKRMEEKPLIIYSTIEPAKENVSNY